MPCNSDHMRADRFEIEMSRVACLLGEINGVKWRNGDWEGYHQKVYPNRLSKLEADKMVAQLCEFLQNHDVTQYSLEMQMWWRDHKKADKERLEIELQAMHEEKERKAALAKLSDYEKKLLGLV